MKCIEVVNLFVRMECPTLFIERQLLHKIRPSLILPSCTCVVYFSPLFTLKLYWLETAVDLFFCGCKAYWFTSFKCSLFETNLHCIQFFCQIRSLFFLSLHIVYSMLSVWYMFALIVVVKSWLFSWKIFWPKVYHAWYWNQLFTRFPVI